MKDFLRKYYLPVILTIAGAASGFIYWKFVGCVSGSCPIKSRWYLMTLYGAVIGYLVGSLITDLKSWLKKRNELKSRMGENNKNNK